MIILSHVNFITDLTEAGCNKMIDKASKFQAIILNKIEIEAK